MVIRTEALTKKFGKIAAVNELNVEVEEGEIFGLLGPNGAGKTTLISMLCTMLKPTSGRAWVNGFEIVKEPGKVRKSIGIVFQQASVDDLLTGRENLELHNLLFEVPKALRKQRIEEVLSIVNLEKRADDFVNTYSGGMRRRLELARGIMHHPKILFLDEPTSGLDPQGTMDIRNILLKINSEFGTTIFMNTHLLSEITKICTDIGIISHGKLLISDSISNLEKNFKDAKSLVEIYFSIERGGTNA